MTLLVKDFVNKYDFMGKIMQNIHSEIILDASMPENNAQTSSQPVPSQHWMVGNGLHKKMVVNANQLTSLSAMIAYIAEKSGQSEFRVERNLSDHFSIPNAKCLSYTDFDKAIRYLADILSA